MEIKVLGGGCANCKRLLSTVETAVKELNIKADVKYITDYSEISKNGIMATPGVIIDKKIVSQGRVPSLKEVKELITKNIAK